MTPHAPARQASGKYRRPSCSAPSQIAGASSRDAPRKTPLMRCPCRSRLTSQRQRGSVPRTHSPHPPPLRLPAQHSFPAAACSPTANGRPCLRQLLYCPRYPGASLVLAAALPEELSAATRCPAFPLASPQLQNVNASPLRHAKQNATGGPPSIAGCVPQILRAPLSTLPRSAPSSQPPARSLSASFLHAHQRGTSSQHCDCAARPVRREHHGALRDLPPLAPSDIRLLHMWQYCRLVSSGRQPVHHGWC
mmetsp:Transcript_4239/g.9900  ORF Transcript_4239/g.9900 Transcript_4239/m.9900 type:complete len:250 (-) Transcript_4239:544-1293(-)